MPNRPVIEIDIQSEPFKRFQALFSQYAKDVKTTNAEWKAMVANSNVALAPLTDYARRATEAYQGLSIAVRGAHAGMKGVLATTGSIYGLVSKITREVAKWTAISAGIGGIGFLGLDALAGSALERQRSARGLGLSIGQQSAFRVNQAPIIGSPDTVLANIANVQQNVNEWRYLSALGINPVAAQNESPFDLTLQAEAKARRLWQQSHGNIALMQAYGVDRLFSVEDLRRLGGMSDQQFAAMQARTRSDVGRLGFGTKETSEWTQLAVQIHRAGLEIEKVFIDGLAPLSGPLKELSKTVVGAIGDFFKSGEAKTAIEDLASGIKQGAAYLTSNQFRTDVRTFVDDFEAVTQKIVAGLKLLGAIPDSAKAAASSPVVGAAVGAAVGAKIGGLPGAALGAGMGGEIGSLNKTNQELLQKYGVLLDPEMGLIPVPNDIRGPGAKANDAKKQSFLQRLEKAFRLPSGWLKTAWAAESASGRYLKSAAGALGDFQFMPGTAAQYGVDTSSFASSAVGAAGYFRHLLDEFGGNEAMAAAAYNWGEGNLKRDIAKYGSAWRRHLPAETAAYVNKFVGSDDKIDKLIRITKLQKRAAVNLRIENNTTSQVAIQANNASVQ
jgi:hypothetical protein